MTDEQRPWVTWPEYERALTALHGVFGAVEAERTRAEAAEAQRDRLAGTLRRYQVWATEAPIDDLEGLADCAEEAEAALADVSDTEGEAG